MTESPAVAAYREQVRQHLRLAQETAIEAYQFGDTPALADELAALVVEGRKRATVGWIADAELDGEALPQTGDCFIILDGVGQPRCAIRVTETRRGPLLSADEAFAWDEGEGDRSLAWWLEAHREFFARRATATGLTFDEATSELLFERFEVVHHAG